MKRFLLPLLLPTALFAQEAEVVDEGILIFNGKTKKGAVEFLQEVDTEYGVVTYEYIPSDNLGSNCCPDKIVIWDLPDNIIANPREYSLKEGEEVLIKLDGYVGF